LEILRQGLVVKLYLRTENVVKDNGEVYFLVGIRVCVFKNTGIACPQKYSRTAIRERTRVMIIINDNNNDNNSNNCGDVCKR
jgi:hypothetical protein